MKGAEVYRDNSAVIATGLRKDKGGLSHPCVTSLSDFPAAVHFRLFSTLHVSVLINVIVLKQHGLKAHFATTEGEPGPNYF